MKSYGTLLCFRLMVLVFWALLPTTFITPRNLANISQQVSMLAVVAFAMTVVMAMGDFDLSVGSMASLAGVVAAVIFRDTGSVPLGVALALATGLAGGAVNGALVSYLGILPFVATLGTLTVFSGLAFIICNGTTIFGADIPRKLRRLPNQAFSVCQALHLCRCSHCFWSGSRFRRWSLAATSMPWAAARKRPGSPVWR
ncbi:MAG: ABC transporter permease [Hyphomicrobiales bacterium]